MIGQDQDKFSEKYEIFAVLYKTNSFESTVNIKKRLLENANNAVYLTLK